MASCQKVKVARFLVLKLYTLGLDLILKLIIVIMLTILSLLAGLTKSDGKTDEQEDLLLFNDC